MTPLWSLFITVNCLGPQATPPDIINIAGHHPQVGQIKAVVVVCERPRPTLQPRKKFDTNYFYSGRING